ncbi:MAG: hypothetical protein JNM84_16725 [Planctomycetes bacterium]|nr:hypothetical protein [Planctomycetota bacterium]
MSLPPTIDAQGRARIATPLAQDPVFLGVQIFVQWLVEGPAGYLGAVALTNGRELTAEGSVTVSPLAAEGPRLHRAVRQELTTPR